jgi:predicted RNA binding protein YcfA (HicA-like mRNA interferase family)
MTKQQKLLTKLLDDKQKFKWSELVTLLKSLGYEQIEGNGSRVKFNNGNPEAIINLHRPHPGNEMKVYAVRQVREKLQKAGLI